MLVELEYPVVVIVSVATGELFCRDESKPVVYCDVETGIAVWSCAFCGVCEPIRITKLPVTSKITMIARRA